MAEDIRAIPRFNRVLYFIILLMAMDLHGGKEAMSQVEDEYALKAAFVLNFARFTEWPEKPSQGEDAGSRFVCVAGNTALQKAFQSIDGKLSDNRTVRVHAITRANQLEKCDIIFIGKNTNRSTLLQILSAVKGKPVLVIGETPNFLKFGGVINFFIKDGNLHFAINPKRADQQQVKISARLLKLATIVEN